MTIPILNRDDSFRALSQRVRKTITARLGKTGAHEILLVLDLVDLLAIDKQDRAVGDQVLGMEPGGMIPFEVRDGETVEEAINRTVKEWNAAREAEAKPE
jgi:hypothetical protein